MTIYANHGGNSGVAYYQNNNSSIRVWFTGNPNYYTYSYGKAGKTHVDHMKQLAIQGSGLNSYIKRHVNNLYD